MSNKQDNELNGVKIFGDLNADVPVESFQTTNTKNPVFSIVNYTLMEGLTKAGQVSYFNSTFGFFENVTNFEVVNFALGFQNDALIADAFTSDNIITTKLGMYLDSGNELPQSSDNKPSKTLFRYDPFRQAIGSVWCLSTRVYDKESNSYVDDAKQVERLKFAAIGDPSLSAATDGILGSYNVFNPYSAPLGAPLQQSSPYTQTPANYFNNHKITALGISEPTLQDMQGTTPITAGSEASKEKEEIIYIEFEESETIESSFVNDNSNGEIQTLRIQILFPMMLLLIMKKLLVILFFPVNQQYLLHKSSKTGLSIRREPLDSTLLMIRVLLK